MIKNSESHSSICLEFNGDSISSCELLSSSHPDGTSLPHVSIDVSVISRLAHHLGTRKCRPFPRHCSLLGMFYITSPTSLLDVATPGSDRREQVQAAVVLEYDPRTLTLVVIGKIHDNDGWTSALQMCWNSCIKNDADVMNGSLGRGLHFTFLLQPSKHDTFIFGKRSSSLVPA